MFAAFVHGFYPGYWFDPPAGVQNVFVFNQGATQAKFRRGIPVVITASICDTLLILLAILGISAIVVGFYWLKFALLSAGILFLLYMGYVVWRSNPAANLSQIGALSPKRQIAFAASVSLLNPHAIMDTVGVIGTNSIAYTGIDKLIFCNRLYTHIMDLVFLLGFCRKTNRAIKKGGTFYRHIK